MKLMYCLNSLKIKGGLERVLCERVNYMYENFNYDIILVTTDQNNENLSYKLDKRIKVKDLNINYFENNYKNIVLRYFFNIKRYVLHWKRFLKIIRKEKPDFIISFGYEDKIIFPFLKKGNFKLIREFHIGKYKEKKSIINNIKDILNKILLKKYDKYITLTLADKILRKDNKIIVISNPLTNIPLESSKCENKKIISVGRLEYQKGYDILIEVWKIISEKYPNWVLEIYGEGSDRKKLQEKINSLGLQETFLLKGTTENIQEKYLESSIYVMSSRFEGFGLVLIEAMSFGLPVVAFDCPCGPSEIITNNKDGFLIRFNNIEQMAKKIEELIIDKEKRKTFGSIGKKNVQRFSQEKIMKQWKNFFERNRV